VLTQLKEDQMRTLNINSRKINTRKVNFSKLTFNKIKNSIGMVLLLFFPCIIFAMKNVVKMVVPFENIPMPPGAVIQASYAFGTYPMIFCYENNLQSIGLVQWPYNGQISSSTLSVTLVVSSQFQGQFADPSGVISVTNTTSIPLIVSCQLALVRKPFLNKL
jgi:hypothetical protein